MKTKLNRLAAKALRGIVGGIELVLIDLAYGKNRYRRHGARLRPIIHRYFYKTVYVRPGPIVYNVKRKGAV